MDIATGDSNTIETTRLVMRPHQLADFDEMTTMYNDDEVVRYLGGRTGTPEEIWTRFLRHAGLWTVMKLGYWVLRDRETGRFMGEVGFADYHRHMVPSIKGFPELGWILPRHAWGQGYATEAVLAAIEWAKQAWPAETRITCIIVPEHRASIRVAEKAGFRFVTATTYAETAVNLYDRTLAS
jgi:RimJ/RimL family protein N-acetyltransferase